jgi:hypothetical protein
MVVDDRLDFKAEREYCMFAVRANRTRLQRSVRSLNNNVFKCIIL